MAFVAISPYDAQQSIADVGNLSEIANTNLYAKSHFASTSGYG
jgi:hypothetical protein